MLSANVNAAARRVVAYEMRKPRKERVKMARRMAFVGRDGR